MGWIAYSLLMFAGSVALYLAVRKASLAKVPLHLVNLVTFAIPLVAYLVMALASHHSYALSAVNALVLMAAALFAYGGNLASLKAIEIAPNPGYSLMLSKSYVLFTTVVSVLFLRGTIDLRKALAILAIVGFSSLIMINRKGAKKVKDSKWVLLSFAAFFSWGFLSLLSKFLFTHGLAANTFLVYFYALVSSCVLLEIGAGRKPVKAGFAAHWPVLLAIGATSTIFNLGQFMAINAAPNVGFVNAINASSISLVTVMSVLLFKDELTPKKGLGIAGVTAGLILLLV